MSEFLSEFTERTDSSSSSIGVLKSCDRRMPSAECSPLDDDRALRVRAEVGEELEVRLRQRCGIAHRFLGSDRAVRLHRERQPIVVGALSNARLGHREVRATHGVVDRVHAHEIHREAAIQRMLIGLDVTATLVDVQLDVELALILEREQVVPRIADAHDAATARCRRR